MQVSPKVFMSEERKQSFARLVISAFCFLSLGLIIWRRDGGFSGHQTFGLVVIAAHALYAVLWHRWIFRDPGRWRLRVPIANFADLGTTSMAMAMAGAQGSFFYPVFLWVVVGYGLRYGRGQLLQSTLTGFLGFGLILLYNDSWASHLDIGLGLLVGILVLPAFFLTVLKRLETLNRKLGEELVRSQAAEQAKGEFVASISHEIRTPLNGVIGTAELLRDAPLPVEYRQYVDIIIRSGGNLLGVINEVLDFSRIDSGQVDLEKVPFDLKAVMEEVTGLLAVTARAKNLSLTMRCAEDLPPAFLGDPTRIRQILTNLVGNALKFTAEGSVRVEAGLGEAEEGGRPLALKVVDTGIGVPADRMEAIFAPFQQADSSTTRRYGGSGLGLAISRNLARLMGGDLRAEANPAGGSVFILTLPLAVSSCRAPASVDPDNLPTLDLHVLLVEDHQVNQLVAVKLLDKLGVTADVARHGAEALEMLDRRAYDAVLMDLHMPVMNGWDAARAIRARQDAVATVPIIALTADADLGSRERTIEAGMDGFVSKPLRMKDLAQALATVRESGRVFA